MFLLTHVSKQEKKSMRKNSNVTINAITTVSDDMALAAKFAHDNYEQLYAGYRLCFEKMSLRDIVSNAKAAAVVTVKPAAFAAALNCLVTLGDAAETERLLYDDEVIAALSNSDALRSALIDALYYKSLDDGLSFFRAYGVALLYRAVAYNNGVTRNAFESYPSMRANDEMNGEDPDFTKRVHEKFWTFAIGQPHA